MNLVVALVLASAPALAFTPYDVPVTDGPTVAPSKSPTLKPTADPTAAPTPCERTFTKLDAPTDAPGPLDCYEACSEAGLKMPCITSAAVNEQLRSQAQCEFGSGSYAIFIWLGYTDVANEGNFVWEDGCTSEFTNWWGGQPDDKRGPGADYAYMQARPGPGEWADWKDKCEVAGTCFCYCHDASYSS